MILETSRGPIELRELRNIQDMEAAEEIQRQVWGLDVCPHPKEWLIPTQQEGGCLAGAFTSQGEMVSLVFSFPTRDPAIQHSQLLATIEEWRSLGIGTRLKWFQRSWCLEHGVTLLRWTVDPLRAANAEININHLGGIASTFYPDYYGRMNGIDAGGPTDRLLLEWHLLSPRVIQCANIAPDEREYPGAQPANYLENEEPHLTIPLPVSAQVKLIIPGQSIKLAQADPALAMAWRMQVRQALMGYFELGYAITHFTRQGGPAYLLEKRSIL